MIETVFALLMFVNGEIKEHRIQPSMGMCLRGKREAERVYSETVSYKCYKGKKVIYKPIEYFVNTSPYNDNLSVSTKDHTPNNINIELEFDIAIEGSD